MTNTIYGGMYFVIYGNLHISRKFAVNLQYLFYVNLHDNLHLCILIINNYVQKHN